MKDNDDRDKQVFVRLSDSISHLAQVLCALRDQRETDNEKQTILCRLEKIGEKIMKAIETYSERVNAAFVAIGASVDEIVTSQAGIAGDVAGLNDIILKLQSTPGVLTPEDQALLDASEAKVTALQSRTAAVSAALKELDSQTDAVPPVEPPVEPA